VLSGLGCDIFCPLYTETEIAVALVGHTALEFCPESGSHLFLGTHAAMGSEVADNRPVGDVKVHPENR
jgi:hypothetical protein